MAGLKYSFCNTSYPIRFLFSAKAIADFRLIYFFGVQICTPAIKSLSDLWSEARKACIQLVHGGVVQARFLACPLPCR